MERKSISVHKYPESIVFKIPPSCTFLDFGCGAGNLVAAIRAAGFNAYGCDLAFKEGSHTDKLYSANILRRINPKNYRLPFEDKIRRLIS